MDKYLIFAADSGIFWSVCIPESGSGSKASILIRIQIHIPADHNVTLMTKEKLEHISDHISTSVWLSLSQFLRLMSMGWSGGGEGGASCSSWPGLTRSDLVARPRKM